MTVIPYHDPRMDYSMIIKYIPDYGVLLCAICKEPHCVPLSGIRDHYYEFHKDTLTKPQRAALKKYAFTFKKDVLDPLAVRIPPIEDRPIEGLYKTNGYECIECGKLLGAESTMRQHSRLHGWDKGKQNMWIRKWMQV